MKTWIINRWHDFATGFWFVPGLFLVGGVVLATALPELDGWFQQHSGSLPTWIQTSATTARAILSALSGALITVTGVVFSTMTVALSITSTQLGPRLLRNFLGQLVTQVALGVCLASSVYCLLLLRQIDKADGSVFVPHGSVLFASVLALVTLMTVVYFTHRVVYSMQAQNVVSDVADDLDKAVDQLFPQRVGKSTLGLDEDNGAVAWRSAWDEISSDKATVVESIHDGYLQAIDDQGLMRITSDEGLVVRVYARPGDYVRKGERLIDATPGAKVDDKLTDRLQRMFLLGNQRTTQQDVECAVNELVEVALRALSPGVNDPFTAITCIDRLSGALRRIASRRPVHGVRFDDTGTRRVIVKPRTFSDVVDAAFNQIRQHADGDIAVVVRLLEALTSIAGATQRQKDRTALQEQADMIANAARENGYQARDLEDIEQQHAAFVAALRASGS